MKVCVVGLDGATWDLLDPWLDDLPTLRGFAEEMHLELDSCVPPLSIPAWKCYATGMDPGGLGVFTFVEPDFEERRFNTVTNETFTHRELWDYLGTEGYQSAVINMPTTYPPRDIPGWMVSGPFSGKQENYARPSWLEDELDDAGYTILPDYYLSRDPADLDGAVESVRGKFDAALRLAPEADFLHLTVYLTDTVQHTEWDSPASKAFWIDVDRELGRFLDDLGEEWNVILMSDHGFGKTAGRFYLNTWLEAEGYLRLDRSGIDVGDLFGAVGLSYERSLHLLQRLHLAGIVHEHVPERLLRSVARQLPGNRKLEGLQGKIDWDSPAVALAPLIYTRTAEIAEEIRDGLLDVRDDDGTQVIEEVYYGEELYPNPVDGVRVPDLVVKHTEYGISDIVKPGVLFEYDGSWRDWKIAHHRRNGVLMARGPDVKSIAPGDARLYDLAPTILDGFGLDIPEAMRGRSLGLLGGEDRRAPIPVERDAARVIDHDEAVEQKLEDLGYL